MFIIDCHLNCFGWYLTSNCVLQAFAQTQVHRLYSRVGGIKKRVVKELQDLFAGLLRRFKKADAETEGVAAEHVQDVLADCYGGEQYHVKTCEMYGFNTDGAVYEELNLLHAGDVDNRMFVFVIFVVCCNSC